MVITIHHWLSHGHNWLSHGYGLVNGQLAFQHWFRIRHGIICFSTDQMYSEKVGIEWFIYIYFFFFKCIWMIHGIICSHQWFLYWLMRTWPMRPAVGLDNYQLFVEWLLVLVSQSWPWLHSATPPWQPLPLRRAIRSAQKFILGWGVIKEWSLATTSVCLNMFKPFVRRSPVSVRANLRS